MHGSESPRTPVPHTSDLGPVASKRPRTSTDSTAEVENRRKDPKVSRACDTCKRKKIRCNGTLPCENCAKRKLSCAYDAKYGRGRPPTPPFSRSSRIGDTAIPTASALSGVNNREDRPPAHQIIGNSGDTSIGLSNQNLQETEIGDQYFDPTSGLNFLHRAWRKLSTQRWQGNLDGLNDSDKRQLLESAGDRPLHVDRNDIEISSFACIPQESAALKLLEFYFETCVVTYRMLHRPTTEAWMNAFLRDRRENKSFGHSLGNARSAILLAIMAIATLRYEKVYGNMSSESEIGVLVESDRLFCMSAQLTEAETGFPRLESAQARLLQVLYLLQTSRMNKGWYTFGNTCSITLSLGMHRKREFQRDVSVGSRRLGYISLQCYKRTFWVAYTIDRYLSVVFGRPKLYQDEDIDQELPETVNDEDMTNQGISLSEDSGDCLVEGLIFHASIARIVGNISRQVYCVGNISKDHRLEAAQSLMQQLHAWRDSLPAHLGTVKPSTLVPSFRRQAIALQLAYSHAIMHATRPFLLGDSNTETSAECISAAKASLELVDRMAGDKTLFHSFWWTHYVTFCALAVVYVWGIQLAKQPSHQSNDEFYSRLFDMAEKCRVHLRQATAGLSPNRRYDVILEELRREARNCYNNTSDAAYQNREFLQPNDAENNPDFHETFFSELPVRQSDESGFLENAHNEGVPSVFGFEGAFQFSDWLTLDSSAFFPVSDPNSVSPPWLSAIP